MKRLFTFCILLFSVLLFGAACSQASADELPEKTQIEITDMANVVAPDLAIQTIDHQTPVPISHDLTSPAAVDHQIIVLQASENPYESAWYQCRQYKPRATLDGHSKTGYYVQE